MPKVNTTTNYDIMTYALIEEVMNKVPHLSLSEILYSAFSSIKMKKVNELLELNDKDLYKAIYEVIERETGN